MFTVQKKLKRCKIRFFEWRKSQHRNAGKEIEVILKEMEAMQVMDGRMDWERWRVLKSMLDKAYKSESGVLD